MKPIKLIIKTKSETYPIIIGSNLIKDLPKFLSNFSINFDRCLLVIDKKVPYKMISKVTRSLSKKRFFKLFITANEKIKVS